MPRTSHVRTGSYASVHAIEPVVRSLRSIEGARRKRLEPQLTNRRGSKGDVRNMATRSCWPVTAGWGRSSPGRFERSMLMQQAQPVHEPKVTARVPF